MWNEAKGVRYFPKEDGSFDLEKEDVRDLRFFVEIPGTAHSEADLHHSLHHQYARVSTQCRSLQCPKASSSPKAKRLRIGDVLECHDGTSSPRRSHADVTEEILRQLEELREDVGKMLTMMSGNVMQDRQVHTASF